ncbi:MAG: MBL fold metallo-hydrolase [Clostridia bacterium]|nr:MBL fold metallo-hydrolase [Clostridia bacterium]
MARFCSLFSSSSGNCSYVGQPEGGILIDVGISAKRTAETLDCIGVDIGSVGAIFVTHEHTDHIQGIRVLASKHKIPVYASAGTLEAMAESGTLNGKFPADVIPDGGIEVNGMFIRPFHTPHDSRESLGFTVETADGNRIAVATDIGTVTNEVLSNITCCQLVMLESNHDVRMLQNNPNYPYILKRRILSDRGHLSNDVCAKTAADLIESGTTRLILGHLSKENNMPELAYQSTYSALSARGMEEGSDYILRVAGTGMPKMMVF